MVALSYSNLFDEMLKFYTVESSKKPLVYRSNGITTRLTEQQVHDLLRTVITHPQHHDRLIAVKRLARVGQDSLAVQVLTHISLHDPSLELRAAASKAVNQIRSRMRIT